MSDTIECVATVKKIRFYKENFGIIVCSIDSIKSGKLPKTLSRYGVTFKGTMPYPVEGNTYNIKADYVCDTKWGDQYNIRSMFTAVTFDTPEGKRKFLESIFSPYQVENMYNALEDPFTALDTRNYTDLIKIKGCGMTRCTEWADRFAEHIGMARILLELGNFDLTNKMVKKLLDTYESPDVVVEKVQNNPYVLCTEVSGIGFKKADEIAMKGGISPNSTKRIKAYISYYLTECGENGQSWITPDHLLGAILDTLGENIPDEKISEAIRELIAEKKLWTNKDKSKLGLQFYYDLEFKIATELIRLRDAECDFKYDGWEDVIKRNESLQGWEYTDEQIDAIKSSFTNNVMIITGYGGTGKSNTVSAILNIFKENSHVICALSGKASSVLGEYTGEEGYTIHRLLGFPQGDKQGFVYHDDNPLPYDIVVVDEISMIGAKLFYYLLRAIPTGSKVIMLGDDGQLESIGCGNVASNMLASPEIHHNVLTKIHRQAAKSAIITESIKARQGIPLIAKDWVGSETRGELKDFDLICYSDASNTYYKILEEFQKIKAQPNFNIMETQVIVPMKTRGMACVAQLNDILQELCNPHDRKKKETTVFRNSRQQIIREGDKVICKKNNYRLKPNIFNGSTGILRKFDFNDFGEPIWIIDFKGIGEVIIPDDYWSDIELNYCGTVHSNQGSQYDNVIIGLDFGAYTLLTRELVYTAITRAKKKCVVVAQNTALRYAVGNKGLSKKQTHLVETLHDVAHPKLDF